MSNNILKKDLRIKYKSIRKQVNLLKAEEIANAINRSIKKRFECDLEQGYIGIYWPLEGEISLLFLKDYHENLALPGINNKGEMDYYPWKNKPLIKDKYQIPAPMQEKKLSPKEIGLLFVPAIAIDIYGYRLGYGGGFYDRLRANKFWQKVPSLAVVPNKCISPIPLPRDSWDIPFNGWISEDGETTACLDKKTHN